MTCLCFCRVCITKWTINECYNYYCIFMTHGYSYQAIKSNIWSCSWFSNSAIHWANTVLDVRNRIQAHSPQTKSLMRLVLCVIEPTGTVVVMRFRYEQTNERAIGDCVLAKISKMMTNLMTIMTSLSMIKNILKFNIVIMILPIIMTHLRTHALLYRVSWYHCSIQKLRKKNSKSCCDFIVDDTGIIRIVFDRMRYKV